MKLLSTFYSNGNDLAPGWWATVEYPDGRRAVRHLWEDEAGPDFDDLAAMLSGVTSAPGLDQILRQAREKPELVRRTKAVAQSPAI